MNARSKKYRALDRKFLWHPYSAHSAIAKNDFPVIVRGRGPYLFDCEGRRYFDAISSWWCCNLGHNHPRIVKAIRNQAKKLQHSILGNMSHPPAIELAEMIGNLFPKKRRKIFFSSDGASAMEAAIKIAVQYWHNIGNPKRCRLLSFKNAYHGDTLGAVSAGYLPHFHQPFKPLLFPVLRAAAPFCGECSRSGRGGTGLSRPTIGKNRLTSDEPDSCDCQCFQSMQETIEKYSGEIAAVIVEPLCQCAAGMKIYPPAYLKKLAQLCRAHGILLIADEIAVGFGRTGTMFAFEQAGIDPDIVCVGKSLAGGYLPISAAIVKENIYSTFSDAPHDHTFYHGHTFAGNPIAAAAAIETLKIYGEENIVGLAGRKGEMLADKMSFLGEVKGVRNVRHLGMIAAFDFQAEKIPDIRKKMLEAGALIRPLGNTIYLMPPLNTPDNLLGQTIELLEKTLEDVK